MLKHLKIISFAKFVILKRIFTKKIDRHSVNDLVTYHQYAETFKNYFLQTSDAAAIRGSRIYTR